MRKIKTLKKVKQLDETGLMYYQSRRIVKFTAEDNGYVAIIEEQTFDIVTEKNEEGKDIRVEKVLKTYVQEAKHFTFEQVQGLFKLINTPILSTEDFNNKFYALQTEALLKDTIMQNEGKGRLGTVEWIKY